MSWINSDAITKAAAIFNALLGGMRYLQGIVLVLKGVFCSYLRLILRLISINAPKLSYAATTLQSDRKALCLHATVTAEPGGIADLTEIAIAILF